MLLLIDYREKAFIDKIKRHDTTLINETNEVYQIKVDKDIMLNYKIINLDIGDFLICNNISFDELSIEKIYENLILLIERKTYSDLSSSIIDGRFREQKSRIENTIKTYDKIMYIIEGTRKEKEKHGVKMNILEGAILNLIFKHKFKLLNTNNIDDTFDTIFLIYKKYKKHE
jgi:ERCC4-type nuclease